MANLPLSPGLGVPFNPVFPKPIVTSRAPTASDKNYPLGQEWVDQSTDEVHFLSQVVGGNATWTTTHSSSLVINQQVFTTSGTYTPTPGMQYVFIECLGGGGAGGGAAVTGVGERAVGGGAGGGSYGQGVYSAAQIGASQTVTIGAGGAPVLGGAGNAGAGSSVGSLITTGGGVGGAEVFGAAADMFANGSQGGFAGTGGQINIPGWRGLVAYASSSGTLWPGEGANTPYGIGGHVAHGISANGLAGLGFGSGGGGGGNQPSQGTQRSGGAGAGGLVIIREYIL